MDSYKCAICKITLSESETYEYRGAFSCGDHLEEMQEGRDIQRSEIIQEESAKTEGFKGLDLNPNSEIGKGNREILKSRIEIAGKESGRLKAYEGRE